MADTSYTIFSWKKNEIYFVVSVLILVFGVSFFQLKDGERKTRDVQRRADTELVARKLKEYYSDHNFYPLGTGSGQIVSCGRAGLDACVWGQGRLVDEKDVEYLVKLPQDPFAVTGRTYVYIPNEKRDAFKIYVALERKNDSVYKSDLTIGCGGTVQCNWYVEN